MKYPSFDVNVPPWIRYDFEISDFEFRFYIEVRAMTDLRGYCWATNSYFSKLFNKTERTIQRALSNLTKKGYLDIFIDKEKGNQRKIFITGYPNDKNVTTPNDKNVTHNSLLTKSLKDFEQKSVKHTKNYNSSKQKTQYKSKKEIPNDVDIPWLDDFIKKYET